MKWWGWYIAGFVATMAAGSAYKRYLYRGHSKVGGGVRAPTGDRVEPLDCNDIRVHDDNALTQWVFEGAAQVDERVRDEQLAAALMDQIIACPWPPDAPKKWRLEFEDGTTTDWPGFVNFVHAVRVWQTAIARAVADLGPAATPEAVADAAFPDLYPSCPTPLDPNDPSHRQCIDRWLGLRDAAKAYA